jgi:hypothetical protein
MHEMRKTGESAGIRYTVILRGLRVGIEAGSIEVVSFTTERYPAATDISVNREGKSALPAT